MIRVKDKYMPGPVPVFQWEEEFAELLELYKTRKPLRVLEVGTYHGGTLYHWLQNATKGAHVLAVDSYLVGVDNRGLYEEWCPAGVTVEALVGNSHDPDTVEQVRERAPFDWVFIDAGHYSHEVRRDWDNYGPMCEPGGVVVFHDILPATRAHPEIQVADLWEQIKTEHETTEIVADRDAEWGGLGCVFM